MNEDQYKNLMYAISLDIAVKLKPQPVVDPKGYGPKAYLPNMLNQYNDWAQVIEEYLLSGSYRSLL